MDKKKTIGELLMDYGMITQADLAEGLARQKELGLRLGETLIALGKVRRDDVDWILSKQFDIPFVMVQDIALDPDLISRFPAEFLKKHRILPLYESGDSISIATEDPLNQDAFVKMEGISNRKISVSAGNGEKIIEALQEFYLKGVASDLRETVTSLCERLRETAFYRIDFLLRETSCELRIFGAGILRTAAVLEGTFSQTEVRKVFRSLDLPILWHAHGDEKISLLSVYPLLAAQKDEPRPAALGRFGLARPEGIAFSDSNAQGDEPLFVSSAPVAGYPYLMLRPGQLASSETVCSIDTVPRDMDAGFVDAFVAEPCVCGAAGCAACRELGYLFSKRITGHFSAEAFRGVLKEVLSSQR